MKIRIRGNSIRFRLTRSEVAKLCIEGYIEEITSFEIAPSFKYGIKASAKFTNLNASFESNTITLYVPNIMLQGWNENDKVGFYHDQPLPGGKELSLTLEKDFVCMDQTLEDQSDNYPNPKMM